MSEHDSGAQAAQAAKAPLYIRIHPEDNVAIVANDGSLPAGTAFPCGWCCARPCPRATRSRCLT